MDQIGFQVFPEEGLDNGPGFEREVSAQLTEN